MFQASISYFSTPAQDIDCSNQDLCIYSGVAVFCYAIIDPDHQIIAFEKYNLEQVEADEFTTFLQAKNWLTKKFRNINIVFGNTHTSLVPEVYFTAADKDQYLALQYGNSFAEKTLTDFNATGGLYTVYGIPKHYLRSIMAAFPLANRHHYLSLLLQHCQKKNKPGNNLYVHFLEDVLVTALFSNQQLLSAKTLRFVSNEDSVYRILQQSDLHQLAIQNVTVHLSGWITKNSALYKELYKFIPELHFSDTLDKLKIKNDEYENQYFTLFEVMQLSN